MEHIFVLSLISAANASLLAAVTVMLFLPSPKRLLLGYLVGALLISLSIGFVIVFVVHRSGATSSGEHTLSPAIDLVLGGLLLIVAYVLRARHDERIKERRRQKKINKDGGEAPPKGPSKVEQLLGRGSARVTFALGVVLTIPGVSYLAALRDVQDHGYSTVGKILIIVGFNLMLLILLEIPLVGYYLAPERTVVGVQNFRGWLTRNGRQMAIAVAALLGLFLLGRGVVELLS